MARRRNQPGISAEERQRSLDAARALLRYVFAADPDSCRRDRVAEMTVAEMRDAVEAEPRHPLSRQIVGHLDLAEGRPG